jgi:hypothetical protein
MILNLNIELDREKFKTRSDFLLEKRKVVELTEKTGRSLKQNSYLFLILNIFSIEYGEGVEFVKQRFFKELCNPEIFVRTKSDKLLGEITYLRSSADLSKEEMVTAIDRFKIWASKEAGIFIPDAISDEERIELLRQIDRQKNYL